MCFMIGIRTFVIGISSFVIGITMFVIAILTFMIGIKKLPCPIIRIGHSSLNFINLRQFLSAIRAEFGAAHFFAAVRTEVRTFSFA